MHHLLFLVTEDWYFWSHRLPMARAARDAGFRVTVVTRVNNHGERIRAEGFRLIPVDFPRSGRTPWRDLRLLKELRAIYRRERPDLVHHVALKPVLYGSLAARLSGGIISINALTGLGFVFTSRRPAARLLRALILPCLRLLLGHRHAWTVVQNPNDRQLLEEERVVCPMRTVMIRGSGVDVDRFRPRPWPAEPVTVMLASRLLWDKGVGEFVEAARLLRRSAVTARFVLVGDTDPENPSAVPPTTLEAWQREGVVECWGRREDMPEVLAQAHVICLPSYREGLPKVLLEAAACARPLVATDVPGCREIVADGDTGLLVPAGDAVALAAAMEHLLRDAVLRERLGRAARRRVEEQFSDRLIAEQTMDLYRRVLAAPAR